MEFSLPIHCAFESGSHTSITQVGGDAPPSGPGQIHRLLRTCEAHGLSSTAAAICRAAGAAAWYHGSVGDAAAWMLRARDERRLAVVLEPVVEEMGRMLRESVGIYEVTLI